MFTISGHHHIRMIGNDIIPVIKKHTAVKETGENRCNCTLGEVIYDLE